jgi:hypothetical protein
MALLGSAPGRPVSPAADVEQAPPPDNPRFRSFAERYIIERCREWKEGEIDESSWKAILEAKSIYNKIKQVSRTLGSDT